MRLRTSMVRSDSRYATLDRESTGIRERRPSFPLLLSADGTEAGFVFQREINKQNVPAPGMRFMD